MSQIANIVLKNGAATPADVTFTPVQPMNGESPAHWSLRNDILLQARQDIRLSIQENGNGTTRVRGSVTMPVTRTDAASALSVLHKNLFNFEFVLPSTSGVADRKDIAAYAKNFLALSVVQDAVINFERQY